METEETETKVIKTKVLVTKTTKTETNEIPGVTKVVVEVIRERIP